MFDKRLYTIKEVAELLSISEGTIRNKISKGEIQAVKIYGNTRITREELEKNCKFIN